MYRACVRVVQAKRRAANQCANARSARMNLWLLSQDLTGLCLGVPQGCEWNGIADAMLAGYLCCRVSRVDYVCVLSVPAPAVLVSSGTASLL